MIYIPMKVRHEVKALAAGRIFEFYITDDIKPDGERFNWDTYSWEAVESTTCQRYFVENTKDAQAGDKLPAEKLEELTDGETWLSAEMCIQYGLADEYAEQDADLTAAAKQYQGARAAFQSRDISTLPAAMAAAISAVVGHQEPRKLQTQETSEASCLNNILAAMIK